MQIALSWVDKLRGAAKFVDVNLHRRPLTVSIEVTKRCNARCDFCEYWKTDDRDEMEDFTDVVRRFDPLVVVFSGGEPMLRRDLTRRVSDIRALPGFRYLTLLTHGGLLAEKRVSELVEAGVNQINVSLNYPDARQDKERGIPGLFDKIERVVREMKGSGVFSLSSILMADTMRDAEALARLAHAWGVNIAFSGYHDLKNASSSHFVSEADLPELRAVCLRLKQLKRELRNILTSDYFFDTLPDFYLRRYLPGCNAGKNMIHVSPKGMVQPCSELPAVCHYTEFDAAKYAGAGCGACFDSCRAEPEAPLTVRRVGELLGLV
jgi:MoaA/NifB/PqqE/SkfB family radical SAM enzyme